MIKGLLITIGTYILLTLFACEPSKPSQNILAGNHPLEKLVNGEYTMSGNSRIRFYFLNARGEYQFMEKTLDKVNVKYDESVSVPYVRFYWNPMMTLNYDAVTRVVIFCKAEDIKINHN